MEERTENRLLHVAGQVPALLAALYALIASHPEPEAFLQAFEPLQASLRESLDDLSRPAIRQGLESACDSIQAFAQSVVPGA